METISLLIKPRLYAQSDESDRIVHLARKCWSLTKVRFQSADQLQDSQLTEDFIPAPADKSQQINEVITKVFKAHGMGVCWDWPNQVNFNFYEVYLNLYVVFN